MVLNVAEMPIKCPVAPLEFTFLADTFFRDRGIRDQVKLTYVTPLSGAFTKPKSAKKLSHLLGDKGIELVTNKIDDDEFDIKQAVPVELEPGQMYVSDVFTIHGGGPNKGKDYFATCGDTQWKEGDDISVQCNCADADLDPTAPIAAGDLDEIGRAHV